jgi:hypothetical protein
MKPSSLPFKYFGVVFGIFLAGFAMACIYIAELGSDPITTLIDGLTRTFNIREGYATTIINILFFLFMVLFNRKYIRAATIISILFLGLFMDVSIWMLGTILPANLIILEKVVLTTFGSVLLGLSIGFYLTFDLGSTPSDSIPLWIQGKYKIRYQYCAWIFYSVCLIVGALLGGVFGAGTLIALVVVGSMADFTMQKIYYIRKNVQKGTDLVS